MRMEDLIGTGVESRRGRDPDEIWRCRRPTGRSNIRSRRMWPVDFPHASANLGTSFASAMTSPAGGVPHEDRLPRPHLRRHARTRQRLAPVRNTVAFRFMRQRLGLPKEDGEVLERTLETKLTETVAAAQGLDGAVVLAFDAVYDRDGRFDDARTHLQSATTTSPSLRPAPAPPLRGVGQPVPRRRRRGTGSRVGKGAVLLKWLPVVQDFDMADPRCLPVYEAPGAPPPSAALSHRRRVGPAQPRQARRRPRVVAARPRRRDRDRGALRHPRRRLRRGLAAEREDVPRTRAVLRRHRRAQPADPVLRLRHDPKDEWSGRSWSTAATGRSSRSRRGGSAGSRRYACCWPRATGCRGMSRRSRRWGWATITGARGDAVAHAEAGEASFSNDLSSHPTFSTPTVNSFPSTFPFAVRPPASPPRRRPASRRRCSRDAPRWPGVRVASSATGTA